MSKTKKFDVTKCKFVPFRFDSALCETCGHAYNEHVINDMLPYRDAIWKLLLEHGGPHSFGHASNYKTIPWRIHLGLLPDQWQKGLNLGYSSITKAEYNKIAQKWAPNGQTCAIDWNSTRVPEMEDAYVWQGTFDDPRMELKLVGRLYCVCHKIYSREVIHDYWTVGELLWRVLNGGKAPL